MAYRTDGRVWPQAVCDLDLSGPAWPPSWQSVAHSAIGSWNNSGAHFTFRPAPRSADHLGAYDLGRWNGWLAMAYTRPRASNSLLTSGQIIINLHYEWDPAHPFVPHTSTKGAHDLESALLHELGHLLHLDDEVTAKDVMQPTLSPGVIRRTLGPDDQAGAAHLYPLLSELTVPQLARDAAFVIRGRVVSTGVDVTAGRLFPSDSAPEVLFTLHRIAVDSSYKGSFRGEIDILTVGGQTPRTSLHVTSEAAFSPGEEVVLFLTRDHLTTLPSRDSMYSILGGFQGKYTIYRRAGNAFAWRPGLAAPSAAGLTLAALEGMLASEL